MNPISHDLARNSYQSHPPHGACACASLVPQAFGAANSVYRCTRCFPSRALVKLITCGCVFLPLVPAALWRKPPAVWCKHLWRSNGWHTQVSVVCANFELACFFPLCALKTSLGTMLGTCSTTLRFTSGHPDRQAVKGQQSTVTPGKVENLRRNLPDD